MVSECVRQRFLGMVFPVSPDSGTLDSPCFKSVERLMLGSCGVAAVGREEPSACSALADLGVHTGFCLREQS